MATLFNYQTPSRFSAAFQDFYVLSNVRQVRVLSAVFFIFSVLFRLLSLFYYDEIIKVQNYNAYSTLNWTQMCGTFFLLVSSSVTLKFYQNNQLLKKGITILFIVFLLLVSFSASYTVSMHNTKNTLTLFLIGIATVSLFFALEYIEITLIAIFITLVYWLSMISATISFEDKMMNVFAGVILGFILLCFSRYSYFFKSQHFVRLKQLEEKNLEVEKLHAQQGEILGFVAHDLRNPLHNIEALSTLLYNEDPKEELKHILTASQQAKNIINDLLEAIKTDKIQLDTQALNLNSFLTSTVEKWKTNSKRDLILHLDEDKIYAHANASKLERVLDNLISNAIKFSSDDKIINISLRKIAKRIEIKVKDDGIGIPKELLSYIFQQFSQAGRKGLHGEQSIGLGLHISQKIMQQHGGELLVESEENKGTTFTVLFP
ncbi:His Kinase A (phospho-acceptor) domain-containing protein [Pedobacter insulae]|uniref:histidine kinase n=2 Tax=Pedobacter insulae TaxID=414048 RepID=A0A1I2UH11_9SPHI|nr:His Kinase A (phospho-acceptor) domain-containing protein [Pedobacter insulae]